MRQTRTQAPSLRRTAAALWYSLAKDPFDPYRPELHYMRGPGPRWRAKHAQRTLGPVELGMSGTLHAA
jgi:hypothetical protein